MFRKELVYLMPEKLIRYHKSEKYLKLLIQKVVLFEKNESTDMKIGAITEVIR